MVEVRRETPDVISVVIGGRHLDELRAESGQFFRWRFLTKDLWWVSAPYSLSAPPAGNRIRITVKERGDHSRRLAGLRPGVRVVAEGPYGALTAARRRGRRVLLIAGGVGITPMRALFQTIPAAPGDLTLIYRARTEQDLVFRDELEALARDRGHVLRHVIGSRTELGRDPLTAEALQTNIPDLAAHDVYVCGPPGMSESVIRALRKARVPRRRIHHESFEF